MAEEIIAIEHSGFTSLGTGTAKTKMGGANVILPQWARSLLAVLPQAAIDTVTAAQSLIAQCDIESDDVPVVPFQCLTAPVAGLLGASGGALFTPKTEKYAIGCPLNGGEQIAAYLTALVANTSAPTGGVGLVVSNMRAPHAQRHAKMGTLTSTGTGASADVAGTRYNFSGGNRILELFGAAVPTTVAAADGIIGYIKYQSNEFKQSVPLKLPLNPISGGLGTLTIAFVDGVSRQPVSVPIPRAQVNIQDYLYMGLAPGTAGNFVDGLVY
ncbi:hypothetical protein, partial [Candidatus Methanoperedens nitratireducens]|uniref:hypothetical protein n=1 Tax=Candidatus Methanoperedens nitratireducens TaxID=1392998 RepID=UPI0011776C8E